MPPAGSVTVPIWLLMLSSTLIITIISGLIVRYERYGKGMVQDIGTRVEAVETKAEESKIALLEARLEMSKFYLTKAEHDRTMERIDTKLGDLDKKLDNIRGSYRDQGQRQA